MTVKLPIVLIALVFCSAAKEAVAVPITITNGNFEAAAPQMLNRAVYIDNATPTGWETTGTATTGFYANALFALGGGHTASLRPFHSGIPDQSGPIIGHPNETLQYTTDIGGVRQGALYQTTTTINAQTEYTVRVQVLNRKDEPGFPQNPTFSFFAGSLVNAIVEFDVAQVSEGWGDYRNYSVSASQLAPYIGETLGIAFHSPGSSFLLLDNITMEAIDVPVLVPVAAPAAPALLMFGLLGLLFKPTSRFRKQH